MSESAVLFPFSLDSAGNIRMTQDQDVIWSNRVRLAVGTIRGERIMRPNYGTKTAGAAFETQSSIEELMSKEINKVFAEQLPLLSLVSVDFRHDTKTNVITADILYQLPNRVEQTTQVGVMTISSSNPPYEELV